MKHQVASARRGTRPTPLIPSALDPRAQSLWTAARTTTITLLLASIGCLLLLHVLRRDLNPVARRLSEYVIGPYGPLMTTVFFAMGLALIALTLQVYASSTATDIQRLVAPLIALAGIGLILAGIFKTGTESMLVEIVHSRASAIAVLALTTAAVVSSRRSPPRRLTTSARAATLAAVVAVATGPILHDSPWSGIGQRFTWLALAAWLLITAWQLPTEASTERPTEPLGANMPRTVHWA